MCIALMHWVVHSGAAGQMRMKLNSKPFFTASSIASKTAGIPLFSVSRGISDIKTSKSCEIQWKYAPFGSISL